MSINRKLEELYTRHWDKALSARKDIKMSNPLLIKVDEEKYSSAGVKIMIFGQETYGWNGEFGNQDVDRTAEFRGHLSIFSFPLEPKYEISE